MALQANGIISGAGRASEPEGWKHAEVKPAIQFTWHHTIPLDDLTRLWNGLINGGHWNAVDEYLQIIGFSSVQTTINELKAGKFQARRDELHTAIQWPGWNIVEGPGGAYREDDPGNGVESWYVPPGGSNGQRTILNRVKNAICPLIEKIPRTVRPEDTAIDAETAKRLAAELKNQRPSLRGKGPIEWNPDMWEQTREGRKDKNRDIWLTTPQWRARR
ncbi:hypothetical protein [Paraburkholderia rhizosphaerae]|uniref:Uncharacterized protein n=1 Tax=Paraburkholderia rhizosphaerae TaxID=480658 RepID=A0A4R8LX71_9BURK|nr:hypothetical protein [Paraburkholderia rhizosphaerae]TDY52757.1 hypothetical protein BX592_10439 [Paraburkholderia rhizosphaerae]